MGVDYAFCKAEGPEGVSLPEMAAAASTTTN